MKRFQQISILSVAALGACTSENKEKQETSKPNIIWIFADDHDQRAISAYGGTLVQTPNIDRIATEGMIFDNSFVSNSICAPCRAVILTGKHSHKNGVIDNGIHFDGSQQTFPKLLQKAGYETALIGKWHLHTYPTGFNHWSMLPGHGQYLNPQFIENGDTIDTKGYITDITTDFAIDYMENKRDKSKPFMLMLQNKAPHSNFLPAFRHMEMFKNDTIPVPETFFFDCSNRGTAACNNSLWMYDFYKSGYSGKVFDVKGDSVINNNYYRWLYTQMSDEEKEIFKNTYLEQNRQFVANFDNMTEEEKAHWSYQRYIKDYLKCVMAIDENVGRVLDYLEESGLAESTIVMYSSDQGFYLGDFGWMDKRMMYEISLRTPLIARWPKVIQPGTHCSELVQNIDMASTFLDLAGAEIPADMQGESLLPLIKNPNSRLTRDAVYYHYYGAGKIQAHYGVRTATQKLIYFYAIDEWEFYNLEKDPQELNNQINVSEFQDDIARLKIKLKELQEEYEDNTLDYVVKPKEKKK